MKSEPSGCAFHIYFGITRVAFFITAENHKNDDQKISNAISREQICEQMHGAHISHSINELLAMRSIKNLIIVIF